MATVLKVDQEASEQIEQLVASGSFASAAAVVEEGVRLVQEREAWLRMVDAKVAEGQADYEAGRVRPLDEVFDELERRILDR